MVAGYDVFSYGMNVYCGFPWYGYPVRKETDVKRPSDTVMLIDVEGAWPPSPSAGDGSRFYLSGPGGGWSESYAYRHRKSLNVLFIDGHVITNIEKMPSDNTGKFLWEF